MHVLELATGKKIEAHELGGPASASPAISDGYIVVGSTEGVLTAFKAGN
ncbi:MAG: PQQ-binding-like beta-propeller repeat protein [Planctomycetes bacterium]|nr:PQQ-binding-like beta-propeller repeat protein [Planctomycetota bacterium]